MSPTSYQTSFCTKFLIDFIIYGIHLGFFRLIITYMKTLMLFTMKRYNVNIVKFIPNITREFVNYFSRMHIISESKLQNSFISYYSK